MATFPLAAIQRSAERVEAVEWERTDHDPPSTWAESSVLVAFGFSFKRMELLPFDPPVMVVCPLRGTELPRGPRNVMFGCSKRLE